MFKPKPYDLSTPLSTILRWVDILQLNLTKAGITKSLYLIVLSKWPFYPKLTHLLKETNTGMPIMIHKPPLLVVGWCILDLSLTTHLLLSLILVVTKEYNLNSTKMWRLYLKASPMHSIESECALRELTTCEWKLKLLITTKLHKWIWKSGLYRLTYNLETATFCNLLFNHIVQTNSVITSWLHI